MAGIASRRVMGAMRNAAGLLSPDKTLDMVPDAVARHCVPVRWAFGAGARPVVPGLRQRSSLWHADISAAKDEGVWGLDGPYCLWVWPGAWAACTALAADPAMLTNVDVVVDVGCGGGIIGLVAQSLGVKRVVLNDICPVAAITSAAAVTLSGSNVAGVTGPGRWLHGSNAWAEHDATATAGDSPAADWAGAWIEAQDLIGAAGPERGGGAPTGGGECRVLVVVGDVMYDGRSTSAVSSWCERLVAGDTSSLEARPWMRAAARGRAVRASVLACSPRWPAAVEAGPGARGWELQASMTLPSDVGTLCHGLGECDVWRLG